MELFPLSVGLLCYSLLVMSPDVMPTGGSPIDGTQNAFTISLSTNSIALGGSGQGTITLPKAAGPYGIPVALSGDSSNSLSVSPVMIVIPAGQVTGSFTFTGTASGTGTVAASSLGYSALSNVVTVYTAPIPNSYFGMTVGSYSSLKPSMKFGTTRSWDANNLGWASINPSQGTYSFAGLDSFIAFNQARHSDIIYTFGRTPQWASSKPSAPGSYSAGQCAPPSAISNWDSFVTAIATHAAGKIKYWEIWNEPQDQRMYCGDIPTLVKMGQHAAQIIKTIDPTAVILSPAANGPEGPAWLLSFLEAGGSAYVDVIAFHGYSSATPEDIATVVGNFKNTIASTGVANKEMWDTEASWAGYGNLGTPTSAVQTAFIARSYLLQWSLGVSRFVWYAYDGGPIWGGLWTASSGESAAAAAYKEVSNWMIGATLSAPCQIGSNSVWTCPLARAGGYRAEAIWVASKTINMTVPAGFEQYRDLSGVVHSIQSGTVTVSNQPILLENGPAAPSSLQGWYSGL